MNKNHIKSGQTAFKVLNFFLRSKKNTQIVPEKHQLDSEEIRRIFRRCFIKLRAIYILNQVSQ